MKVTVAILDQDAAFRGVLLENLMKLADKNDLEMKITTFETLQELDRYEFSFDLLLMDTDYSGRLKDGIDWIRGQKYSGLYGSLIYVSDHEERVFEAVLTSPLAFVRKANLEDDLRKAIVKFTIKITNLPAMVVVPEGRRRYFIIPEDVMYFYSSGHYIEVTSPKGEITLIRGKLAELEKMFCGYGFLRVHTSYVVNLKYVSHVEKKKIIFSNKTSCYISDKFREYAWEKLGIYKYEKINDEGAD